jgi:hypothetical protein
MANANFTPAYSGHPAILEITRAALRDAALSDRPNDAIDTLADALLRLTAMVEVRHA